MSEPYFFTPNNIPKLRQDVKEKSDGYCECCIKPISYSKYLYCSDCFRMLFITGQEKKRVKLGDVGLDVVNWQMSLSKSFFKRKGAHISTAYPPLKYRGRSEDRLSYTLEPMQIDIATTKLRNILLAQEYIWNNKKYYIRNNMIHIAYDNIKEVRNIDKRLLYNLVLYFISYYINNNSSFKSYPHFISSCVHAMFNHIKRTVIRTNIDKQEYLSSLPIHHTSKYYYWLHQSIHNIVEPIVSHIPST